MCEVASKKTKPTVFFYTRTITSQSLGKGRSGVNFLRAMLLLLVAFSCMTGNAERVSDAYVTTDTLQIYFRTNKINLDEQFRANGTRLTEFARRFNELRSDTANKVRSVLIVSGASPEGTSQRNRYLSDNRAKVVYDYLTSRRLVDSANIEIESRGVDWIGLVDRVKDSDADYKNDVLDILAMPEWITTNGTVTDSRKLRLMNYRGGEVWRELYGKYFADLRGTRVMISYDIPRVAQKIVQAVHLPALLSAPETANIAEANINTVSFPSCKKPFYMAAKTNMLYDALLVPNVGVEFYLGKDYSLAANWMYAWWKNDNVHNYWRTYGGDIEFRRWWGSQPLRGHHLGVYGQIITYDFELGGRGYLGDKWSYAAGVAYGYSLPVARHFNIDFSIGIGYLRGDFKEYLPLDGHYVWQSTKMRNWIGPTKIEVSLVWLLGRGNINKEKGGRS